MGSTEPDIVVLREGEERLSMSDYCTLIQERLPEYNVQLASTSTEEEELAKQASVITGGELRKEVLENANELKLFAGTTSNCSHLPLDRLKDQNVAVTNAAGIHAPGIAEQIVGNMLVFARNLYQGWKQKAENQWLHYQANELQDSTVTIVGLGAIGLATARRLEGFNVDVVGIRYTPKKGGPVDEIYGFDDDIESVFARTDYLILSCPLTEATEGLIDEDVLATLPSEAVVINTARGKVINTPELVEALQTGGIRGAALDVTDPEPLPPNHTLWTLDNALITPHMGGHTPKHWSRLVDILEQNMHHIAETETYTGLKNQVVTPE